jgi:hypothetical protein
VSLRETKAVELFFKNISVVQSLMYPIWSSLKKLWLVLLLVGVVIVSCTGTVQPEPTKVKISAEAQAILDLLNGWGDVQAINIVECPNLYPGYVDKGETNGWLGTQKQKLQKLGYTARWNCKESQYDILAEREESCRFVIVNHHNTQIIEGSQAKELYINGVAVKCKMRPATAS